MANPTADLSREEQIVAYFVQKCAGKKPQALGRTQLMKLLYLADYEARRYLGRPLSDLEYYWHHFGPYEERFVEALGKLGERDVVREEQVVYPTGLKGYEYRPGSEPALLSFGPIEREVLKYVCTTYSDLKLSALLSDVVYETEPMKEAREHDAQGEKLNMDQVNNSRRNEFGIPFEELYERVQDVRAGKGVPHVVAMSRLRESILNVAA